MNKLCPGPEALERLLDDRLGWLEEEELNRHIEVCALCRDWLDQRLAGQLPAHLARPEGGANGPGESDAASVSTDPRPSTLLQQALTRLYDARNTVLSGVFPQIDGYEIEALLGRGASGVVYRARHKRLGRTVALKLAPDGADLTESQRQRFRQEAEALAQLRHPNIVQVFDVGEAGSRPWFAMEYVHGATLAQRIDGRPQDPRSATLLVAVLARAIDCAHRAGILHRDLKPSNILLEEQSAPTAPAPAPAGATSPPDAPVGQESGLGRRLPTAPKIVDFGLVRRLEPADRLTATHEILGTPGYMAPEQSRGQPDNLGPATDVYALGAILYELLTGRPPFRRATAMETLLASSFELPVSPARLEPAVSRDLETICLRCLEKEPRLRFASAAELADELERVATHRPIVSRPPGAWGRLYRACRRNPGPSALAGLVALLLGLGACGAVLFLRNEVHLRQAADAARQQAEEQRADAVTQRQAAEDAQRQAELQRSRADENLRLAQLYLARSAQMLAPEANLSEQVTETEMRLREELERIAAELQGDFAERQPEESELTLAQAEALRRRVYWQQLRRTSQSPAPEDSVTVLREALRLAELPEARAQHGWRADLLRLRIQNDLARILQLDHGDEALEIARAGLSGTRQLLDQQPGDEELLLLMCDLHRIVSQRPGPEGVSIQQMRDARAEVLERAGSETLGPRLCERILLMWRTELIYFQIRKDQPQELAILREIHEFLANHAATSQPARSLPFLTMRSNTELGQALARDGQWDEAVTVLRQARRPPRKQFSPEETLKRSMADHDRLLAEALVQTGQPGEAVEIYRELIRNAGSDAEAMVTRLNRLVPLLQLNRLEIVRSELQELSAIPRIGGDMALMVAERSLELLESWGDRPGLTELREELRPRVLFLLERASSPDPRRQAQIVAVLSEPRWQKCVDSPALNALKEKLVNPPAKSGTAEQPALTPAAAAQPASELPAPSLATPSGGEPRANR